MANAGIVTRTDFLKAMEPTLNEVFTAGYDLRGEQYSKVFDMRTSEKRQEEIFEYIGPAEIIETTEGAMYQRVSIEAGRSKTYLHTTFKAEIKVTEEMIEDNLYDQITQAAKMLGIAAKRTVEKKCAAFFSNGFSSQLTPDVLPVFSDSHVVQSPDGSNPTTWDNLLTGSFSSNAIKQMRTLMRKTRDEKGNISPYYMNQLIVPPDLEWVAGELLKSNMLYDTANHTSNVAGQGLELVVLDHLADATSNAATQYFGRDKDMAMNVFFWRVKPTSGFVNEEATGDPIWRARMRFSLGAATPRGLIASTGTT